MGWWDLDALVKKAFALLMRSASGFFFLKLESSCEGNLNDGLLMAGYYRRICSDREHGLLFCFDIARAGSQACCIR